MNQSEKMPTMTVPAANADASNSRGQEIDRARIQPIGPSRTLGPFPSVNLTPPSRFVLSTKKNHNMVMPGIMAKQISSPLSGGTILPESMTAMKQKSLGVMTMTGFGSKVNASQGKDIDDALQENAQRSEGDAMPPPPPAVTPISTAKISKASDGFSTFHVTPTQPTNESPSETSEIDMGSHATDQAPGNSESPESSVSFDQIHRQFSQLDLFLQSVVCAMKDYHED